MTFKKVYIPDKIERAAKEPTLSKTTRKRLLLLGGSHGLTRVSTKPKRTQGQQEQSQVQNLRQVVSEKLASDESDTSVIVPRGMS